MTVIPIICLYVPRSVGKTLGGLKLGQSLIIFYRAAGPSVLLATLPSTLEENKKNKTNRMIFIFDDCSFRQ